MNRRAVVVSILVVAALVGACSKKTQVGSGVKVNGEASAGGLALGSTTTTVATTSTTRKSTAVTAKATTTTVNRTTTTQAAAPTLVIKIQGSNASDGSFSPSAGAEVARGSVVRWQNTDSQARSVVADDNSFASPMIPPGGTFDYTFNTPGKVSYHDGTRPFAVGSFTVQ